MHFPETVKLFASCSVLERTSPARDAIPIFNDIVLYFKVGYCCAFLSVIMVSNKNSVASVSRDSEIAPTRVGISVRLDEV